MKQSRHSELSDIPIITVTCLYGNCAGIVRVSRNHLTNVFAVMDPIAVTPWVAAGSFYLRLTTVYFLSREAQCQRSRPKAAELLAVPGLILRMHRLTDQGVFEPVRVEVR